MGLVASEFQLAWMFAQGVLGLSWDGNAVMRGSPLTVHEPVRAES